MPNMPSAKAALLRIRIEEKKSELVRRADVPVSP